MKKYLLITLLAVFAFATGQAQTTIPNLDLENWDDFGSYEEPAGGVWTTANKVVQLSSLYPVTTTKSSDAHSGSWAAKIETSQIPVISTLVTGTLSTGEFRTTATPPNNLLRGTPYTARPGVFRGWYKFTSVQGDSCSIYMWLHKWNGTGRDTVGFAGFFPKQSVNTYTQWDIPIDYKSSDSPDSVSIVFASSAAGELFQGQVGNTLWIDDLEITSATGVPSVLMPEIGVSVYPNPASEWVELKMESTLMGAEVDVYAVDGRIVATVPVTADLARVDVADFAAGTYTYVVREAATKLVSGTFLVK